jgi:hypothetical protein
LVSGEPVQVLLDGLRAAFAAAVPDGKGMARVAISSSDPKGRAVMRALMRVEAELLRRDARLLRDPQVPIQAPDDRRFEALLLLAERVAKVPMRTLSQQDAA